jgi:hypothetical protein
LTQLFEQAANVVTVEDRAFDAVNEKNQSRA